MDGPGEWFEAISNLGFPIVLVFYLLLRLEKSFNHLEDVIDNLISELKKNTS